VAKEGIVPSFWVSAQLSHISESMIEIYDVSAVLEDLLILGRVIKFLNRFGGHLDNLQATNQTS